MIKQKDLFLRNYKAFLPRLEKLPYTHRYWGMFRDQYFPTEEVIDERVVRMILNQVQIVINRTENQTEEEFDDCDCNKRMCFSFHNPDYPVIRESLMSSQRIKYTIIDDIKEKYKVELINENELDNPLIINQDFLLGGIKVETRFKDNTRKQVESFIEEEK